jgi:ferredoxin
MALNDRAPASPPRRTAPRPGAARGGPAGVHAARDTGVPTGPAPRNTGVPTGPALQVDPIGCRAHGLCAELLPGYVTLDEWGYPILPTGPVPPERLAAARAAVRECPTLALRIATE